MKIWHAWESGTLLNSEDFDNALCNCLIQAFSKKHSFYKTKRGMVGDMKDLNDAGLQGEILSPTDGVVTSETPGPVRVDILVPAALKSKCFFNCLAASWLEAQDWLIHYLEIKTTA